MSILDLEASDRLNPIVVKEIRQGLRSRAFVFSFLGLLAICLAISLICFSQAMLTSGAAGRQMLPMTVSCLAFISLLILPITAYQSMVADRSEETWSTLRLTRLTVRQILRGKIASALVQGALLACVAGPFLLFSYFLGGVSLPSIAGAGLFVLVLEALVVTVAISWAAAAAAGARAGPGLVVLLMGLMFVQALFFALFEDWSRSRLMITDIWPYLFVLGAAASFALLSFELAASRLAFAGENTIVGPRLALFLHLGVLLLFLRTRAHSDVGNMLLGYGYLFLGLFGVTGLGGAVLPPRALRGRSVLLAPFTPGALNAWRAAVALACLWSVFVRLALVGAHFTEETLYFSLPAQFTVYLALVLAARTLLPNVKADHFAGGAAVALFVILGIVPFVLGAIGAVFVKRPFYALVNPLVALGDSMDRAHGWQDEMKSWGVPVQLLTAIVLFYLGDLLLRARAKKALDAAP